MNAGENYFEIFGLPLSYQIDFARLEEAYHRLTFEHHPDLVATAGAEQQSRSLRISARVNDGYRTLNSEGARSAYLLVLLAGDETLDGTRLPEGFLGEMFLLQEELDDLDETGEPGKGETQAALKQQVDQRMKRVLDERKVLFAQAEQESSVRAGKNSGAPAEAELPEGPLAVLQEIQTNLNCEKYLLRLLARLA